MRLTNAMRNDFVQQVMNAIPWKSVLHSKKDSDMFVEHFESNALPEDVNAFRKKHRHLLAYTHCVRIPDYDRNALTGKNTKRLDIYLPNCNTVDQYLESEKFKSFVEYMQSLRNEYNLEVQERETVKTRLQDAVAECTTLEKLKLLLPDLESYFPVYEKPQPKFLPVAADTLASSLIKMGLPIPKGDQK